MKILKRKKKIKNKNETQMNKRIHMDHQNTLGVIHHHDQCLGSVWEKTVLIRQGYH